MKFPIHDWQFLVATAFAIGALLWLLRRFLPGRRSARRRVRRATLTIEGRAVGAAQQGHPINQPPGSAPEHP